MLSFLLALYEFSTASNGLYSLKVSPHFDSARICIYCETTLAPDSADYSNAYFHIVCSFLVDYSTLILEGVGVT
jgi:hypothetical protein